VWATVFIHALQQGCAIFNPLPLSEKQSTAHVPRLQNTSKAVYSKLILLSQETVTPGHQNEVLDNQGVHLRECAHKRPVSAFNTLRIFLIEVVDY